jgi:NADH-quinone oxidoreductase subunit J
MAPDHVLVLADTSSGAETAAFWILAPLSVLAALGMLVVKKAVHSALLLAMTMMALAIFYLAQDATFLGIVQVVVYTGAIMMLFLFVLMLVGVDASDSLTETIRGQRVAAGLAALGFGLLLVGVVGNAVTRTSTGLSGANKGGNVQGVAQLIFTRYVFAFEVTSALLITAALGAMVLAHRERHTAKATQREMSEQRFRSASPSMLPAPGVYALHNAVNTPALLPDGSTSEASISRVLRARGNVRETPPVRPELARPDEETESSQLGKGPTP